MSASHSQSAIVKMMHDKLVACNKVDVLHGDLSPQNVSFVAHESGDVTRLRGRTGTWQFISHWLLMTPGKTHMLQDDLQSYFWTLLLTALYFIPSSLSGMPLANMLMKVFDEARWDDDLGYYVGGIQKYIIISQGNYILQNSIAGQTPIVFDPPATPLNTLVKSLWHLFCSWEWYHNVAKELVHPTIKSDADKLLTSEAIIQLFKDAYSDPDWSQEISDRKEGPVPREGRGSSSKRADAEEGQEQRKTQRVSQTGDATSSRLEMLDE
ncbi:hypothetical protein OE88DRAFT_1812148 [Heliocybe sulcata]|uniref:Fungal-type protein kinase domain-containing protein n=1 Tax=Heliocybe sulcata TaxID=5364 RepID=A0A5C3MMJ8_9AGAM|nr:hypothetical protein OE88DRAFT_1812148 [Heliocybe sulcata]